MTRGRSTSARARFLFAAKLRRFGSRPHAPCGQRWTCGPCLQIEEMWRQWPKRQRWNGEQWEARR